VGEVEKLVLAGHDPSPSRVVEGRQLLQEVRQRLSEEECQLADLRGQGLSWEEIVVSLGGSPGVRRQQLAR